MNIFKKIVFGFVSLLFVALLFTAAFDIGFNRVATHPETVKKLIKESGVYDSAIPSILQQTKKIEVLGGTFSADNPVLVKAASQAIPPQYIQQNTELVIDSVYRWLDGTTTAPDFEIKLTDIKAKFADNLAAAVQQHSAGLPACKSPQEVADNNDPLTATCLPPGLTAEYIATTIKEGVLTNQDFIKQPDFTAYDINSGSKNVPIFQKSGIKDAPMYYQRAKMMPLILTILLILTGLGVVFLSSSWQKGLKHAGIVLVVIGVVMMLFALSSSREVNKQLVPNIKADNLLLQKNLRNLATELTQQISKNYWFFGGLYTVLGTGAIVAGETFRRRGQTAHNTPAENPDADQPKPALEAKRVEVPSKPKSKPKKVKIQ